MHLEMFCVVFGSPGTTSCIRCLVFGIWPINRMNVIAFGVWPIDHVYVAIWESVN
jgi:nitrate reductase NapE component